VILFRRADIIGVVGLAILGNSLENSSKVQPFPDWWVLMVGWAIREAH
jgi:hypothetical protein